MAPGAVENEVKNGENQPTIGKNDKEEVKNKCKENGEANGTSFIS